MQEQIYYHLSRRGEPNVLFTLFSGVKWRDRSRLSLAESDRNIANYKALVKYEFGSVLAPLLVGIELMHLLTTPSAQHLSDSVQQGKCSSPVSIGM